MLSHLLADLKLDDLKQFANVETATIEAACSELDANQLKRILRVYTNADDMFTQRYLHGTNENIKTLVDMGKAINDTPEQAQHMFYKLLSRETLYFRCLVEVYREWHKKSKVADLVAEREIEHGLKCELHGGKCPPAVPVESQAMDVVLAWAEKQAQQMEEALTEIKVVD
jgi:hypothetical protein